MLAEPGKPDPSFPAVPGIPNETFFTDLRAGREPVRRPDNSGSQPGASTTQRHLMITMNAAVRVTPGTGCYYSDRITIRSRAGREIPAICPWTSRSVFKPGWTALPTDGLAGTLLMRCGVVT